VRQFFTVRFWLTLAALGGLAVLALVVAGRQQPEAAGPVAPEEGGRRIDLVTWVYGILPDDGFEMRDGIASADIAVAIDGTRTMIIQQGTPGEITCARFTEIGQCSVAVDLLGDGVLWFSIFDGPPSATVQLPAVREVLDNGWLLLANGWELPHADIVDRVCDDDSSSLSDFISRYGDEATSTFDVERQQIVRVTCPGSLAATTTVTIPLTTTTAVPGAATTVPPTTEEPG
jgi:hypothetical protein